MEARELFEGSLSPTIREQLERKWGLLVKDIPNKRIAQSTALLLENEMTHMKYILSEAAMGTASVAEYTKFLFPLITRVWPSLIANNIASVQVMDGPIGAIAIYKNIYGTTKGTVTAGQEFPDVNNFDTTYSQAYTSATGEAIGTGDGTSKVFFKVLANTKLHTGSVVVTAGTVIGTDSNGVISGTGITAGSINYETGTLVVQYTSAVGNGTAVTASYSFLLENTSTGISEVRGEVVLIPIRAGSRKLVSLISVEAAEDLRNLYGADAEADLIAASASQVALEVDREIISIAQNAVPAGHKLNWSSTYDGTSSAISRVDHLRTLIETLSVISQKIFKATLRNPANWIVTSPDVVAILDMLPEFVPNVANLEFTLGVQKAGVLNGKWVVYSDPYHAASKMLLGYKGPSFADAGIAYAPYIPLQLTPTFFNPQTFQMSKGIRTRYAVSLVNANFFGEVTVTGLS